MRAQSIAVLLASCIAVFFTAAVFSGCKYPQASEVIELSEGAVQVGDMFADTQKVVLLQLRNPTNESISINRFEGSCSCTSINPQQICLGPFEQTSVTVSLSVPDQIDEFSAGILPISSDAHLAPIAVVGTIQERPVVFHPTSTRLPVPYYPPNQEAIGVQVALADNVKFLSASMNAGGKEWPILDEDVKQTTTSKMALNIVPPESLPVGPFHIDVIVAVRVISSGEEVKFSHSIDGEICDSIWISPRHLPFGLVRKGVEKSRYFTVRQETDSKLDFISCSGPDWLQVVPLDDGGYFASANPQVTGSFDEELTLSFLCDGVEVNAKVSASCSVLGTDLER